MTVVVVVVTSAARHPETRYHVYTRSLKKKKKTLRTRERSSDRICRSGGTRRGYIVSAGGGLGARRFYIIVKCRARVHIDRSAAVSSIRNSRVRVVVTEYYCVETRPSGRRSAICAGHRENLTPRDSATGDVKAAAAGQKPVQLSNICTGKTRTTP